MFIENKLSPWLEDIIIIYTYIRTFSIGGSGCSLTRARQESVGIFCLFNKHFLENSHKFFIVLIDEIELVE